MTSEDLFGFSTKQGFEGYDELPPEKRNKSGEYSSGPKNRELLNRMNRKYLHKLGGCRPTSRVSGAAGVFLFTSPMPGDTLPV